MGVYRIEPAGDNWEVYRDEEGDPEDLLATVQTEALAEKLVDALEGNAEPIVLRRDDFKRLLGLAWAFSGRSNVDAVFLERMEDASRC